MCTGKGKSVLGVSYQRGSYSIIARHKKAVYGGGIVNLYQQLQNVSIYYLVWVYYQTNYYLIY
jgi:hypothetical protein